MYVVVPIPKSWSKKKQQDALDGVELPISKPDWDNYGKTVDALNLVCWMDDGQIVDGRVRKRYGDRPGTWVHVGPYQPEDWPALGGADNSDEGVFG